MSHFNMPGPVQPTQDLDVAKKDLATFGYCVLAEAIPATRAQTLRQRVEEQSEAERRRGLGYAYGAIDGTSDAHQTGDVTPSNRWVSMLINKGQVFLDLLEYDTPHQLLAGLLGDGYLLSSYAAHLMHPGVPGRPVCHTDQWWMPQPHARTTPHRPPGTVRRGEIGTHDGEPGQLISPPVVAQLLWLLSDFREESGGTRIIPGSHLSGEQPSPEEAYSPQSIGVTGPAGTAVLFDGRLWHGAGTNRGSDLRIGLFATFCAGMFRPLENYVFGTAPAVLAKASPRQRALLGFLPWQAYGRMGENLNDFISFERDYVSELRD